MCVCVRADRAQRQEREVMLKLKEVVDRQRDELRAKVQQIGSISKEVEAVRRRRPPHSPPPTLGATGGGALIGQLVCILSL